MDDSNKRLKKFQIRFTEKEFEMIGALSSGVFGEASMSDTIRRCIQERYSKAFPAYISERKRVAVLPEFKLTDEQKCEQVGGEVFIENGIVKGKIFTNADKSMYRSFPIEMIDNYI